MTHTKNNRNKPCYCGSGLKTKKCCESAEARKIRAEKQMEEHYARIRAREAEQEAKRKEMEEARMRVREEKMREAGHVDGEESPCPFCAAEARAAEEADYNRPLGRGDLSSMSAMATIIAMSLGGGMGMGRRRRSPEAEKARPAY